MHKLENILIPLPKEIKENDNKFVIASFGNKASIMADCTSDMICESKKLICQQLQDTGSIETAENANYKIIIKSDSADKAFKDIESDEAYYIKTGENESVLCGKTEAGTFYAAVTFCDMICKCGDNICVPDAYIFDYPDFEMRGHFFECRYGTEFMTKQDWFDAVDYLAKSKINRITIGLYGCWSRQYDGDWAEYLYFPLEKYPQVETRKNIKYYSVLADKWIAHKKLLPPMFEDDFFGDLIAYAKRKNIIVRPLFNSLGHNTLLPKFFPECASKDENGNSKVHGFCTKNEKTYELMYSIYDNIIDKYLVPNDITEFHVGLDEVMEEYKCHCDECSKHSHANLMVEYMIKLCQYLKKRGMKKIFIYHDMLFHEFDIVNEELVKKFKEADIYDEVVMDWWNYDDPKDLFGRQADKVNNLFNSIVKPMTGYYGWVIESENNENVRACTKLARELNFKGVEAYGSFDYCFDKNFLTVADVAWNKDACEDEENFNLRYATRLYNHDAVRAINAFQSLSDVMKDDSRTFYRNWISRFFEYYNYSYRRDLPGPRNFPADAYKYIVDDEKKYITYLQFAKQKGMDALDFFENNGSFSKINDMWKLAALHYVVIPDEYLTLYGIHKSNDICAFDVLKELDRLIIQREKFMALAESTKAKSLSYTYMRNATIFRQVLLDIRDYFRKEIAKGNNPKLDMLNLEGVLGTTIDFFR